MTVREALNAGSATHASDGVVRVAAEVAAELSGGAEPAALADEVRAALALPAETPASGPAVAVENASVLMLEGIALTCDALAGAIGTPIDDEELIAALVAVDALVKAGDTEHAREAFTDVAADVMADSEVSRYFGEALPRGTSLEVRGWATGCALLRNAAGH